MSANKDASLTKLIATIVLVIACAGCTESNPAFTDPVRCADSESLYLQSFAATHPDKLDVLFVLDPSPASDGLRSSLTNNATTVVAGLGAVDYRIGVTTAGGDGSLAECGAGNVVTGSSSDPTGELSCLFSNAPRSTALPNALDAAARALDPTINVDFLRSDARLLIIFISALDDCSSLGLEGAYDECEYQRDNLIPVADLYQILANAKDDGNGLAIASISGPDDGLTFDRGEAITSACTGALGSARHGKRYAELTQLAAPWSAHKSACTADVGPALAAILGELSPVSEARYCLGRQATDAVRSVELVHTNGTRTELVGGVNGGFAFLGPDAACATGSVVLDIEARTAVSSGDLVDILFCGP